MDIEKIKARPEGLELMKEANAKACDLYGLLCGHDSRRPTMIFFRDGFDRARQLAFDLTTLILEIEPYVEEDPK
jgi:hypothetical protein